MIDVLSPECFRPTRRNPAGLRRGLWHGPRSPVRISAADNQLFLLRVARRHAMSGGIHV